MFKNKYHAVQLPVVTLILFASFLIPLFGFVRPAFAISTQNIAVLTNQQRAAAGLAPLSWNGALAQSAWLKAQDMCAKNYWGHTSPDGLTFWSFMLRAGYNYTAASENLANGYTSDGGVMNGWMASPTHRANILSTTFADIGVATIQCTLLGSNTTLVVAHFGSTGASRAAATPTTTAQPAKPAARTVTTVRQTQVAAPAAQPAVVTPAAPVTPVTQPTPPKSESELLKLLKFSQNCRVVMSGSDVLAPLLDPNHPCR